MQRRIQLALIASLCLTPVPAWAGDGTEMGAEKIQALVQGVLDQAAHAGSEKGASASPSKMVVAHADGCTEGECTKACMKKNAPGYLLSKVLSQSPSAMKVASPVLLTTLKSPETSELQANALLEAVLGSGASALAGLGDKLLQTAPERLADPYVLAFAESGSKGAFLQVTKQVKKGEGGVLAAAFLGLRGEKVARKTLRKFSKTKDVQPEQALDVLIAGHALGALGDGQASYSAQVRVQEATLAALDRGDLKAAQHLAGTAYLVERVMRHEDPRLSLLSKQLGSTIKEVAHKYPSADEVFHLIERITPTL